MELSSSHMPVILTRFAGESFHVRGLRHYYN